MEREKNNLSHNLCCTRNHALKFNVKTSPNVPLVCLVKLKYPRGREREGRGWHASWYSACSCACGHLLWSLRLARPRHVVPPAHPPHACVLSLCCIYVDINYFYSHTCHMSGVSLVRRVTAWFCWVDYDCVIRYQRTASFVRKYFKSSYYS